MKWKFIATKEYIEEGMAIPRGYAVAYHDLRTRSSVCYPIGIHFLIRWSRDPLFWVMTVGYPGYRQRIEHEMYLRVKDKVDQQLKDQGRPPIDKWKMSQ